MANVHTLSRVELAPGSTLPSIVRRAAMAAIVPAASLLTRWLQRARTRREIALLDDRLALDIGLDPDEVRREVGRPFWERYAIARFAELERAQFGGPAR